MKKTYCIFAPVETEEQKRHNNILTYNYGGGRKEETEEEGGSGGQWTIWTVVFHGVLAYRARIRYA